MPVQLTNRDHELLQVLQQLPLTNDQLFQLSQTFADSFPSERVLRRRMQRLAEEGMVRRFFFAFPSNGRNPAYWRLTRTACRVINEIPTGAPLPKRSVFSAIGVSLHFHTHRLNEVLVSILVAAAKGGIEIEHFEYETQLKLDDQNYIKPDATLHLRSVDGRRYIFFAELDTASERIATKQRLPSSIQKKLEQYERFRRQSSDQFRVLFVTTSSRQRAVNILRFSDAVAGNRAAECIYATYFPALMACKSSLLDPVFANHKLNAVPLVRKARSCRIKPILKQDERVYAHLSRKEFTPWWSPATLTQ